MLGPFKPFVTLCESPEPVLQISIAVHPTISLADGSNLLMNLFPADLFCTIYCRWNRLWQTLVVCRLEPREVPYFYWHSTVQIPFNYDHTQPPTLLIIFWQCTLPGAVYIARINQHFQVVGNPVLTHTTLSNNTDKQIRGEGGGGRGDVTAACQSRRGVVNGEGVRRERAGYRGIGTAAFKDYRGVEFEEGDHSDNFTEIEEGEDEDNVEGTFWYKDAHHSGSVVED